MTSQTNQRLLKVIAPKLPRVSVIGNQSSSREAEGTYVGQRLTAEVKKGEAAESGKQNHQRRAGIVERSGMTR